MPKISRDIIAGILVDLPTLREDVKKEFNRIAAYCDGPEFYSDQLLIDILPYAAYEYIILCWGVEPARIDVDSVVFALNNRRLKDIRKIVTHALRRLASVSMMNAMQGQV